MTSKKQIILGIDPGLADTGFGVISKEGQTLTMLDCGSIKTKPQTEFMDRLKIINFELKKIIKKHKPDIAAVEELFFCKNAKTALLVGQARGVCLLTIAEAKIEFTEFTPLQIKQAITGYGKADKNQVGQMVKFFLNLKEVPKPDDAADALGAAITCANTKKF
ncbi:crossover junction endodeoxyribonuclease RuvC [bacterium]|jgi:crossover junction endodeoxyribonuclease RuvC|nr:crossover junction endodeoxyribonuclease RuvC [bacterium]MBT4335528.1 crossover junction endodeoxyribonuclease RuvC [bacterium]MBT4495417.1 crossover junction endodeoxyribonuclease RuvC [bacterium]MBT4763642.1 crossover junction endodeoxyribonuclease RuvC [bacterium]MBT5401014.1 crossover junction endodeoxyribonuclease RuvC [bacterium]